MDTTPTPAASPPTIPAIAVPRVGIKIDPTKIESFTLIPLDRIKRAAQLTADAVALTTIDSAAVLTTADELASTIKALENETDANCKEQLAPLIGLLETAKDSIKSILGPLEQARKALAERVVAAKDALGITEATHCYASRVDDLQILDESVIPQTVVIPAKGGAPAETIRLLKPDEAAIKRAIKAHVHVAGVYMGKRTQIGTKSAP